MITPSVDQDKVQNRTVNILRVKKNLQHHKMKHRILWGGAVNRQVTHQIIIPVCAKACKGEQLSVLRLRPIETHLNEFTILNVLSCFLPLKAYSVGLLYCSTYNNNMLTYLICLFLAIFQILRTNNKSLFVQRLIDDSSNLMYLKNAQKNKYCLTYSCYSQRCNIFLDLCDFIFVPDILFL